MTFDREELLSMLTDASPALAQTTNIPGLDHFWFDGDFLYAYNGGLGLRFAFKNELDGGLPGRPLLGLLKTSALKQIEISFESHEATLTMGKSKVKLLALASDLIIAAWNFPTLSKKTVEKAEGTLLLTEEVIAAMTRVEFARLTGKPLRAIENGIVVIPRKGGVVEFYATDRATIARAEVEQKAIDFPRFIAPWAFVDQVLSLVEPGARLLVMDNSLMVEGKGVLICSNLLELPAEPDPVKTLEPFLAEEDDNGAELPAGLQALLDRALILAGSDDALVKLSSTGKSLVVSGKYKLGSIDEEIPVKGLVKTSGGSFNAHHLRRGLSQAKTFRLSDKVLALEDGDEFIYVLAPRFDQTKVQTRRVAKSDEEEGAAPARRRMTKAELDDEIPF